MRYIFVSDIHGEYDKLIIALQKVNFNRDVDTLVSLGDPFDRGNQNLEVLQFLMGLPHRILVAGNHDLRLKEILLGQDRINHCDRENGILNTLRNFCDNAPIYGPGTLLVTFKTSGLYHKNYKLLWQYFDECVYGLEWKDLIAVHAWIPTMPEYQDIYGFLKKVGVHFDPHWREADRDMWYDATWSNVELMMALKLFPEKKMIIGHWHAWRLHCKALGDINYEHEDEVPLTTYEDDHVIGIDGCVNFPAGLVNTYVYETDEAPKMFLG